MDNETLKALDAVLVKPYYANRPNYCGIEGIKYFLQNNIEDPKLYYKGRFYNAYDIEDYFHADWEEGIENGDYSDSFAEYLADHADDIRYLLDNEIAPIDKVGKKTPIAERD